MIEAVEYERGKEKEIKIAYTWKLVRRIVGIQGMAQDMVLWECT